MSGEVNDGVVRRLLEHPDLAPGDRPTLERFVRWCGAYAELERAVLGDLEFDVPLHAVEITRDPDRVDAVAAQLAATASGLLELAPPVLGLARALESHGARVFRMPLEHGVLGAFYFGETAPAFLVNSRLSRPAGRMALAHLYAHFLADVDPYEPVVCRAPGGTERRSPRESLADAFARALLMPASLVAPVVEGSEGGAALEVLAGYLDLPRSSIAERLRQLGHDPRDHPEVADDWWTGEAGTLFPERLVALALEGIHEDRIGVDEFAEALRLEREEAVKLLSLSSAPEAADPD